MQSEWQSLIINDVQKEEGAVLFNPCSFAARISEASSNRRHQGAPRYASAFQASSMRQTAWAAIPSSLPVKPNLSVVVALTFTCSLSASKSRAIISFISPI